jgi:hypothetical protein
MRLIKAIVSGVILYAIIFLVASALLFIKNEVIFGSIVTIIGAVVTFLISKFFYFKGMNIVNPVKEGLLLGLVLVVVMFVIEVPVMVYGFAKDQGWNYFLSWSMLLGYLLTLLIPVLAAWTAWKAWKKKSI